MSRSSESKHVCVGFGFGPILGGFFVHEAYESGNFCRIVIAEVDQELVKAVKANNGSYYVNVAKSNGIETIRVDGIEVFNPNVEEDRRKLSVALSQSTEIVTSLPSVKFYDMGEDSVASLIAQGLKNSQADATIIYTAENDNRAAEILEETACQKINGISLNNVRFLNTVIGKMSRVVADADEINELDLKTIAPGIDRAFLVEEFNKILVTKTNIPHFTAGIEVFIEKEDLLPFEEAKLYGHNAVHALLAFLGACKGYTKMRELKDNQKVMKIARDAFLNESGAALVEKYSDLGDELFTATGYKNYAEDLLERMTNPYLSDTIERAARDPVRKLGISDRIFGTMSLAIEHGIEPVNMAVGAMAGIAVLLNKADENNLPDSLRVKRWQELSNVGIEKILMWIWGAEFRKDHRRLIECVQQAKEHLAELPGT
jgi:mannitol-1-phosphate 5-dehydrogenase